jgi:hypothetical protein
MEKKYLKSKNISIKLTKCFLSNKKMVFLGESIANQADPSHG